MNDRPAVVLALLDEVDFVAAAGSIATRWAMLRLEHSVRARLPVYALRVAVAVSPYFGARIFLSDERIVLRNSAVVVQAQDFAAERVESLCNLFLCRFARRDVEFAVGAEAQTTSC